MSPSTPKLGFPLQRIFEIDIEISKMGMFKIFNPQYWRLLSERDVLREQGISQGISIAINDLVEVGILKEMK